MTDRNYLREDNGGLIWGRLVKGVLVRRFKRFIAEVKLNNNHLVNAHCPNTGSMAGCSNPGWPVYLSRHNNPKRRLKYTWEITEAPDSLVGVNTGVPNRLVMAAAQAGKITELTGYSRFKKEVKTGDHTRLDLVMSGEARRSCHIEIKNCTLVEKGRAFFPDAVTTRGRRHLEELARLVADGGRGVIFFLIQRMDAQVFSPADHIDPLYGQTLREAVRAGVEPLAYDVLIKSDRIDLSRRLPVKL